MTGPVSRRSEREARVKHRQIAYAAHIVRAGGVIAYPTEAVYGLGCDPGNGAAVLRLLELKRRPLAMGVILIAADFAQLEPYLAPLASRTLSKLRNSWPGPMTWVLPARAETPYWLRGAHATLAVRVTAHPLAAALCRACGHALVSTSANRSSRPPARNALAVRRNFGTNVDYVLSGVLGGLARPTPIYDAGSGRMLRAG